MELQIRVRRSEQAVRKEPEGAAVLHPAQSKYKIILISELLQERSLRNKPARCLFYLFIFFPNQRLMTCNVASAHPLTSDHHGNNISAAHHGTHHNICPSWQST